MKRPINDITFHTKKLRLVESPRPSIDVQKKSLPIFNVRKSLLDELRNNKTTILIGETGCGKTTQIPQYLLEDKLNGDGIIGITQPRRMAAITIGNRVALEMKTSPGALVGFSVRFEDVTSPATKIKYLTDGMLLREAIQDPLLSSYTIIILDEAHERTIHTDILFGIVKRAQQMRGEKGEFPLKVVVMSATMEVDHFSEYFSKAPVVYLEGRQFPVHVYHTRESHSDYLHCSMVILFQINREAPPHHDILVFLTGQEEIEACASTIRTLSKEPGNLGPNVKVYPLYAALAASKQLEVFNPPPSNTRKVILSTNIAETSLTIPGIKYVIDSGMVKLRNHHPSTGLDLLKVQPVSQAQAWQRTGRAGRDSEGICYRTYTKKEFDAMKKTTEPEILRTNLSNVFLHLSALGLNALTFDFMDKPSKDNLIEGFEQLKLLGAIDDYDNPKLTEIGQQMAEFPLDPRFGKVILAAHKFGCMEEIVMVISVLSSESVFVNNSAKKAEAAAAHEKFFSCFGDHATLLNIFKAYNKIQGKHGWCYENFFNSRNLDYASRVRRQLLNIVRRLGLKVGSISDPDHMEYFRRSFLEGFFMNLAQLQRDRTYLTVGTKQIVHVHPSSVMKQRYSEMVLFTELVETSKCYMRGVTPIDPLWVKNLGHLAGTSSTLAASLSRVD